ncbi:MAG: type II CAAX endopeptidase family protein [Lachnospiraceae bacterium]|nr:type II CAAX endopeptidase family protein [Lachnospiraceae bacterium]
MRKTAEIVIKVFSFFMMWLIGVSVMPIPDMDRSVIWRFFAELQPLLIMGLVTILFLLIEEKKLKLGLIEKWSRGMRIGSVIGIIWILISIFVMYIFGIIKFEGSNDISLVWLWFIAAFLNVMMQELLVRGYLYQFLKQKSNMLTATIVTTGIFTMLHGGAVEAGIIPVLNVLTMSVFMTVLLEWTTSIWAPIMAHYLWNAVGSLVFNVVLLADDYPHIFTAVFLGNDIISGGVCRIEGSIWVLIVNSIFCVLIGFLSAIERKRTVKRHFTDTVA